MAVVSSCCETLLSPATISKPLSFAFRQRSGRKLKARLPVINLEEGGDDVGVIMAPTTVAGHTCWPMAHTKSSDWREQADLIKRVVSGLSLQLVDLRPGIASNRGPECHVPGLVHTARHNHGSGLQKK